MEKHFALRSIDKTEKEDTDYTETNLMKVSTQEPPHIYQQLQLNQCSKDAIYDKISKCEQQSAAEHKPQQTTDMNSQPEEFQVQSPVREAESVNIKVAMRKMKIALSVMVTVNIVMLMLLTAAVTVGGIQIQSKFEQVISAQNLSASEINELIASTNKDIDQISMQLQETYNNISSIWRELSTTNDNLTYPCGPGEWRRVAYLNMSDPSQQCPSTWREYNTSEVRACGRPSTSGGTCAGTIYTINFQYSRVCGRVVGYQFGTPNTFNPRNINQGYIDGISITRGSPREHVWTYTAGLTESSLLSKHNCPCSSNPGTRLLPSFVGKNYYCESGNSNNASTPQLYTSDKLWDGIQCEGSCCTGTNTPPWFSVQLFTTTSDDNIEIRICGDQGTDDEDTPVELIEIYVAQ